ncbi:17583_t:CDS:2, partial [Racocetra persica]
MSDLIPYIIWEKQEGYLCAQHCINSLLQGNYFSAIFVVFLSNFPDLGFIRSTGEYFTA